MSHGLVESDVLGAERLEDGPQAPLIGLDLGKHETRLALPVGDHGEEEQVFSLPTVLGYSREKASAIFYSRVGEQALSSRNQLRLVNPLAVEPEPDEPERDFHERRASILQDFAAHLRGLFKNRYARTPWGVVNRSVGATREETAMKRAIANELFDRILFADDTFLLAFGIAAQEVVPCCVVLDVGESSSRATLLYGEAPRPENRVEIPCGGEQVNESLRRGIEERYPELLLTWQTLNALKRQLAFVAPAEKRATLELRFRGGVKQIDLTEIVRDACTASVKPLTDGVRAALRRCTSDEVELFLRNIFLVGGGGDMVGLAERLEQELRDDGFDQATVRRPHEPTHLVAKGAARWAASQPERKWTVPLFSFGS